MAGGKRERDVLKDDFCSEIRSLEIVSEGQIDGFGERKEKT